jgi:hypothetical protein
MNLSRLTQWEGEPSTSNVFKNMRKANVTRLQRRATGRMGAGHLTDAQKSLMHIVTLLDAPLGLIRNVQRTPWSGIRFLGIPAHCWRHAAKGCCRLKCTDNRATK